MRTLAALLFLASGMAAQLDGGDLRPLIAHLRAGDLDGAAATARLLHDALPEGAEREDLVRLLQMIEATAPEDQLAAALERMRLQRTRGRPERMLPTLLVLRARHPDDARVLFALGEAASIDSPVFDAALGTECFERLLAVTAKPDPTAADPEAAIAQLCTFLDVKAADYRAEVRQTVLGCLETLAAGNPVRLWRRHDARVSGLLEDFAVARERGDQQRMASVAAQIGKLQPQNPSGWYVLGAVHASLGPAFDLAKATECFDRFLAMTEEDRFAAVEAPPEFTRQDVVHALARSSGQPIDELQSLRIDVKHAKEDLAAGDRLLLFPHRKALEAEVIRLGKQVAELRVLEAKLAVNEQKLAEWKQRLEADYQRPRGIAGQSADSIRDQIDKRARAIKDIKKKLADKDGQPLIPRIEAEQNKLEARLAQMRRPG